MLPAPARLLALSIGLSAALATAAPRTAVAQAKGALDRLDPAPAGDPFFGVPSAEVDGRARLAATALVSYARDPLVVNGGSGDSLAWVRDQAFLHVMLSAQLFRRLELAVDLPFAIAEGGQSGSIGPVSVTAPHGAALADLRAGGRLLLLRQQGLVPAASLAFSVWVPIGGDYSGSGTARYQPAIIVGGRYSHFVWTATMGARFQSESSDALIGSQIVGGAGAAFLYRGLQIGPELQLSGGVGDKVSPITASTTFAGEVLLGARYTLGPVTFGLAGGPGLGHGPGAPSYRLIGSVGVSFDALPVSREGDAGSVGRGEGGPPGGPGHALVVAAPTDSDGDGVPDAEDACPSIVGDASPGAYRRGCPPDRDRDGIFDRDDHCPDVPGVASSDPLKNGCPLDTDGDGIPDDKDACPTIKGPENADPTKNGCPTSVRLVGTEIVILEQVNFATGKAEIKPESFGLLAQVAAVFKDHPEIARVAVDGHTDNRGGEKPNITLSESRAMAVVRWLVEHGVDARRLESRGFGPRRPIADNTTDAGRAKNRRVEFQIRRRTTQGEAGWQDGPIEPEQK